MELGAVRWIVLHHLFGGRIAFCFFVVQNPITLAQNLKIDVGFKGYVMSDWGATHSTSIMAGLDVEMPSAGFMNENKITAGLAAGSITEEAIDDSVYRILRAMFAVGVMDEPLSAWSHLQLSGSQFSRTSSSFITQL